MWCPSPAPDISDATAASATHARLPFRRHIFCWGIPTETGHAGPFRPASRKGTAPCLDSAGLSPSLSSSPPWLCRPPPLRQNEPTEMEVGASSRPCGIQSPHSSWEILRTAAARLTLEAFACRGEASLRPLPLLLSRGAPLRAPLFFRQCTQWRFNDYGRSLWMTCT